MLEYDNSAFYYFALTLLCFYIIPGSWYAVSEIYYAVKGPSDPSATARTALEKDKATNIRKKNSGIQRLKKWSFVINLLVLIVALSFFIYLVSLVRNDGEVSRFDPYQILGIEIGTPVGEIKKAYRKLSLKYHPDKNAGDKFAEEMFMKVAKAFEALTDDTARENYEKYGNPDGKQALEVSIGLPRIILDNPKVVLVMYLVAMVVIIPAGVGIWYANSKQYGENNVMYETYTAFYQIITENHRLKMLPEVMAISAECRKLNAPHEEDREALSKLYNKLKSDKIMNKPKFEHPSILTGNILLHAHVLRMTDMLNTGLKRNLDKMLSMAPDLIDGMIEIAQQRRFLATTLACIRLSQHLVQGLWHTDHCLLQLPHFTEDEVKHVARGTKAQAKTLSEYLRVPNAEKKGLAKFTEDQKKDVYAACTLLPLIKVETKLFVEEEDDTESVQEAETLEVDAQEGGTDGQDKGKDEIVSGEAIFEQDLVTLRVTITRENVKEGGSAPPVHAPFFPRPLKEGWWVILIDHVKGGSEKGEGAGANVNIHAIEKISDQGRVVVHDIRFLAPNKPGDYTMDLMLLSDSYLGVDEELEVKFTVRPAAELPEYTPHKEDVELDNEPTLFEMMLTTGVEDESSDEEDEADKDDDDLTEAQRKRREQRKAKKNKAENGETDNDTSVVNVLGAGAGAADVKPAEESDEEEEEEEDGDD